MSSSTPARQTLKPDLPTAARGAPRFASQESVDLLTSKVDGLTEMVRELLTLQKASPPSSAPSPLVPVIDMAREVYEACAKAVSDKRDYEEKECRAVVIGSSEEKEPSQGLQKDEKLISDLIEYCGVPEVKKAWDQGKVKHHRHPPDRAPHARPLKITFEDKGLRDSFLSGVRSKPGRPPPLVAPSSFVRKDLTPTQLQLERAARSEAVKKNLEAGQLAYGVRDYSLISYRTPRALPPHYGSSRASRDPNSAADRISPGAHSSAPGSGASSVSVPSASRAPPDDNVTKRKAAQSSDK